MPLPVDDPTDAVHLLVAKIVTARPRYEPTIDEIRVLASVVRHLEGIPLAIELAGARAAQLGPSGLLAALQDGLARPSPDLGDANPQHRTLHAALVWSWNLLDESERRALARLSVFRGGFGGAAARAVVSSTPEGADSTDTVLLSLRDKSFLMPMGARAFPGEARWSVNGYVHQFAASGLSADAEQKARSAHRRYYVEHGESLSQRVDSDPRSVDRLALELENLVAALEHALSLPGPQSAEDALRLALAVDPLFANRGPPERRIAIVQRALAHADLAEVDGGLVGRVWRLRALCHADRGDLKAARADLERASAAVSGGLYPALEACLAVDRGWLAFEEGELDEARETLRSACDACLEVGDRISQARALFFLGRTEEHRGSLENAEREWFRSLELYEQAGSVQGQGLSLFTISNAQHQLRRPTWAEYAHRSREIARAFGNERSLSRVETSVATAYLDLGDIDRAEAHVLTSLAHARAVGDRYFEAVSEGVLGRISFSRGNLLEARAHYDSALATFRRGAFRRQASFIAAHRAATEASLGNLEGAETFLNEARNIGRTIGDKAALALVRVYRVYLDLVACGAPAARHTAQCWGCVDGGRRCVDEEAPKPEARSEEVCFALDHLQQAIARHPHARASVPFGAWLIMRDGRAFRSPTGSWVSLERRRALRRLVVALLTRRLESPGEAVSPEDLIRNGWPGERLLRSAGLNRLHF